MNILTIPGTIPQSRTELQAAGGFYTEGKKQSLAARGDDRKLPPTTADGHERLPPASLLDFYNGRTEADRNMLTERAKCIIDAALRCKPKVLSTFDLLTALPVYDTWATVHYRGNPRAREHVEKYVREYLETKNTEMNARRMGMRQDVLRELAKLDEHQTIVGYMVNVSALGISPEHAFEMDRIIHRQRNGYLDTNRRRNSAAHACIRVPTPIPAIPQRAKRYMTVHQSQTEKGSPAASATRNGGGAADKNGANKRERKRRRRNTAAATLSTAKKPAGRKAGDNNVADLSSCIEQTRDQTILVYPSGSNVLTGAQDVYTALKGMWELIWMFSCEGMVLNFMKFFSAQNVVSTYRLPFEIDLKQLEKKMRGQIEFMKKQFPAAIFHTDDKMLAEAKRRAMKLKQLRRDIIMDDSWMSPEDLEAKRALERSTNCPHTQLLRERYEQSLVMDMDSENKVDARRDLTGEEIVHFSTPHNPYGIRVSEYDAAPPFTRKRQRPGKGRRVGEDGPAGAWGAMEDEAPAGDRSKFRRTVTRSCPASVANRSSRINKAKKHKLATIIHSTGATVITGVKDPDMEKCYYEILSERLVEFKAESIAGKKAAGERRRVRMIAAQKMNSSGAMIRAASGARKSGAGIDAALIRRVAREEGVSDSQSKQLINIEKRRKVRKQKQRAANRAASRVILDCLSREDQVERRKNAVVALGKDKEDATAQILHSRYNTVMEPPPSFEEDPVDLIEDKSGAAKVSSCRTVVLAGEQRHSDLIHSVHASSDAVLSKLDELLTSENS